MEKREWDADVGSDRVRGERRKGEGVCVLRGVGFAEERGVSSRKERAVVRFWE